MVLKFTYEPGIIHHYVYVEDECIIYASVVKQNIHSPHNIAWGYSVSVNMNVW